MNGYIALLLRPTDSLEWLVWFPDLPDCRSAGRSLDAAVENAREALSSHLAEIAGSGRTLPPARSPGEMLLSANDDPRLAVQMVGAVLRVIEPLEALPLAASGPARQVGFYGEARQRA